MTDETQVVDGEATELPADDTDPHGPQINEALVAAQTQEIERHSATPPGMRRRARASPT